jgi:hypothetical protein
MVKRSRLEEFLFADRRIASPGQLLLLLPLPPDFAHSALIDNKNKKTMKEVIYRGYSIRFHSTPLRWSAQVRRPGGHMVLKDGFITATLEEGESVLLERARARVDVEEGGSQGGRP